MNYLVLVVTIYLAAVTETAVLPALGVGSGAPDLLLIVGLLWLFAHRGWAALAGAAIVGLASDLNGAGRLGPALATLVFMAWAVEQLRGSLPLRHPVVQAACALPAAWLLATLAAMAQFAISKEPLAWGDFLVGASRGSLSTAALALPLFAGRGWWSATRRPQRWQIPLAR